MADGFGPVANRSYTVVDAFPSHDNSTTTASPYDAEGAMQFTVAVVTIYSIGMVGVLVLGLRNKRKRNSEMDKEVDYFVKDINTVRIHLEKKGRLENINKLLKNTNINLDLRRKGVSVIGSGFLPFMALPVFMAQNKSQTETEVTQSPTSDTAEESSNTNELGNSVNEEPDCRQDSIQPILELDETENKDTREDESLLSENCTGVTG